MADSRTYTCPWCKHSCDASVSSCPACGAPVDVRQVKDDSGWSEQPAIRDMAKIQFGQSFCQIEGKFVPVADFKLAEGDGVYFAHHLMLWKDDQSQITAMKLKGGWKRMMAGMPLVMMQATGPGRIAFSKDRPGELIAIPMDAGQALDVREHVFMVATHSVAYDWFNTGIWFTTTNGKDSETHYPIGAWMDRFATGDKPGLLLLHGAGNVFVRELQPGQSILIKPTALLFKSPTVRMHLHFEYPAKAWSSWASWGDRYIWLRLEGPGKVGVQSHFEPMEDNGRNITRIEPLSTSVRWR